MNQKGTSRSWDPRLRVEISRKRSGWLLPKAQRPNTSPKRWLPCLAPPQTSREPVVCPMSQCPWALRSARGFLPLAAWRAREMRDDRAWWTVVAFGMGCAPRPSRSSSTGGKPDDEGVRAYCRPVPVRWGAEFLALLAPDGPASTRRAPSPRFARSLFKASAVQDVPTTLRFLDQR